MIVKKIKIPIYFGDFIIIYDKDGWDEVNKKYQKKLGWDTPITYGYPACVFEDTFYSYTKYVAAFITKPTASIIAHEAVHLVNKIFKHRGVDLDLVNDEPQAYLTGWFVNEIDKFFKKNPM